MRSRSARTCATARPTYSGECVSGGGSAPCSANAATTASVRVKPGYTPTAATPWGAQLVGERDDEPARRRLDDVVGHVAEVVAGEVGAARDRDETGRVGDHRRRRG